MLTNGFGLLDAEDPAESVPEQPTMVSAQADAAIKMVVAMKSWSGAEVMGAGLSSLEPLKEQGPLERLAFVITAEWMGDPQASRSIMDELVAQRPDDALVRQVEACLEQAATLHPVPGEPSAALPPGVTREALAPLGAAASLLESMVTGDASIVERLSQQASRIAIAVVCFVGIAFLAFVVGLVALVMLSVKASGGSPMSRLGPTLLGHQGIHVELFAAWVVYEVLLGVFAWKVDLSGLGTIGVITFQALGLLALAWPVARGLPWSELRRELGLTCGAGLLREVGWGVLAWCMAVPMVLVGIVLSLVLAVVVGGSLSDASHPLQEGLRSSSSGGVIIWYLVAAVVAPVLEEIVFRGGLYRGLRGATDAMPLPASMVVSALLSSLVFAAIHPQGILFVPILGALAVSFCLVRELRGSLVAPMVGHALNNGLIVTLNLTLLS